MNATLTVGLLHPGQMGGAIAGQIRRTGARVVWCREGRSVRTAKRAADAGLEAVDHLQELLAEADIVLSICPPEFAEDVANAVAEHAYAGLYVDANAISPQRCLRISDTLTAAGAKVLDGTIIGPPPDATRAARLYLAGDQTAAARVADLVAGTSVEAVWINANIGSASALKMAYASYQKATRTLAAVAHALAAGHGVAPHLIAEAARSSRSPLAETDYLPSVAARAWRWAPEMQEIADTMTADGLPPDLAEATAVVLARWSADKDTWDLPLDAVLDRLLQRD